MFGTVRKKNELWIINNYIANVSWSNHIEVTMYSESKSMDSLFHEKMSFFYKVSVISGRGFNVIFSFTWNEFACIRRYLVKKAANQGYQCPTVNRMFQALATQRWARSNRRTKVSLQREPGPSAVCWRLLLLLQHHSWRHNAGTLSCYNDAATRLLWVGIKMLRRDMCL